MSGERRVVDVSELPSVVFGFRSLLGWGTLAFIVIEGFTVALAATAYLYLRLNETQWPPGRTPAPDLLVPTLTTLLLLLLILPMRGVGRAAERFDRRGVGRGLLITAGLTVPILVLRWFDLLALHVRWDAHAYASAAWAVVVLHGTLILLDFVETGVMAYLFMSGRAERKHYPDAQDAAFYQYFLSLGWVPLYLIIYWGPRVL